MKAKRYWIVGMLLGSPSIAGAEVDCVLSKWTEERGGFSCTRGPIEENIGGQPWFIYACGEANAISIVGGPKEQNYLSGFHLSVEHSVVVIKNLGAPNADTAETRIALSMLSPGQVAELATKARNEAGKASRC